MKKRVLIISLIVCFSLAIGCTVGAVMLKKASEPQDKFSAIWSFAEKHKKEFESISSFSLKTDTDKLIKAGYFKFLKELSPDCVLETFDLLKAYDSFRIFDVTVSENGSAEKYLILVYADSENAFIYEKAVYSDYSERADKLTSFIKRLDSSYPEMKAKAKLKQKIY